MNMFKKILPPMVFVVVATIATAAESNRLRLMLPIQGSYSGKVFTGASDPAGKVDSVSVSGYNLQYVDASGFGIGYTSTNLTVEEKTEDANESLTWGYAWGPATFLDLSYIFGDEMNVQIILGYQLDQGDLEFTNRGTKTTNKMSSHSGTAFGLNGGYNFGGFEALIGYRSEAVTVSPQDSSTDYDISRTLISAGIGFTF